MQKWFVLLYFLLISSIFPQKNSASISGFITDRLTGKPLQNVNVLVSGINFGHVSDKIGYFEIKNLPKGNYKLIFSLIGYESLSALYEIKDSEALNQEIKLTPRTYSTETIEISSKKIADKHKLLDQFKKLFLGNSDFADSCSIENEKSIDFTEIADNVFGIKCDTISIIKNNALGYLIRGKLNNATINLNVPELSFDFASGFEEMPHKDIDQKIMWQENRKLAFRGTLRHFLLSLYNNRLNEEGYKLYLKGFSTNKQEKIEDINKIIQYGDQGSVLIKTNDILVVKYGLDISTIRLRHPIITITNTGVIKEKMPLEMTGAFSVCDLSRQLPGYYFPDEGIKINKNNIHNGIESFLDSIKVLDSKNYEALKDSFNILTFKYPEDRSLILKYAALLERCCIKSAENTLREITEKDTLCSEAYFRLGLIKAKEFNDYRGSIKKVVDEYEQETSRNNMSMAGSGMITPPGESRFILFNTLNDEMYEETVSLLSKAVYLDPEIDAYYVALANVYEDAQKYDAAIDVTRKLLDKNNENKEAHLLLGMLYFRENNYEASKKEFDIALSLMEANEKEAFIYNSVKMLLDPVIGSKYPKMDDIMLTETIKKFWNTEDPLLLTNYNERLLEHYARVAFSQLRFKTKSGRIPGWQTERGEVLIRYGFPKKIIRYRPYNTMDSKNMMGVKSKTDVWFYENMIFSFYDPYMSDELRLVSGTDSKISSQYEIDSKLFSDNLKKNRFEIYNFSPEGVPLDFDFKSYQFKDLSDPKKGNTQIYFALSACNYDTADLKKDQYLWGLNFFDSKFNIITAYIDSLKLVDHENILPASAKNDIIFANSFKLPPQSIKIASEVLRKTDKSSFSSHKQINVRDFSSNDTLMISDVIISPKVIFGSGSNSAINRNGVWILPKPRPRYSSKDTVHIYFEIYNLKSDLDGINDYEQEVKITDINDSGKYILGKVVNGLIDFFKSSGNGSYVKTETRLVSHTKNNQSCFETNFASLKSGKYLFTISINDKNSGQTAESKAEFQIE